MERREALLPERKRKTMTEDQYEHHIELTRLSNLETVDRQLDGVLDDMEIALKAWEQGYISHEDYEKEQQYHFARLYGFARLKANLLTQAEGLDNQC